MKLDAKESLAIRIIDKWLGYQSRFSDLPGFQACIRKKEQIIFSKAYGYANIKTKQPLKTDHLFHVASHSKTFTSCAVLQLVERGKLALSDTVIEYLPQFKKHKDKRFKQITIRDLLSNRSGIFRDGLDCLFWDLQKPFLSKEQLIQEVLASNLIFSPNECTKYSNIGFSLLGLVLEKVLGIPFDKILDQQIFKKLKNVNIFTDYQKALNKQFADGHSRPLLEGKRFPLKHEETHALAPATGICSNAETISLFFSEFLTGDTFISKHMQQELFSLNWSVQNTDARYGLGLLFNKFPDVEFVGHSGGYPGFSTSTAHWIGTDYTMSFFLNTNTQINPIVVRSLMQILKKINDTFTKKEAEEALVAGSFSNKWGSFLCTLINKKGLCFPLDNWSPCNEVFFLTSNDGKEFMCDNQSGFQSSGEKIIFIKDKKNAFSAMKWGGSTLQVEDVFLKNLTPTLL